MSSDAEVEEDSEANGDDEIVPPCAVVAAFAVGEAGLCSYGFVVVEAVTIAFAGDGLIDGEVFFGGRRGRADGDGSDDHEQGAGDDDEAVVVARIAQLTEDERAPGESPELIGI